MTISQTLDASNGTTMCGDAQVFADACSDLQEYYDTTKPEWFMYGLVYRQPDLAESLLHTSFQTIAAGLPAGLENELIAVAGDAAASSARRSTAGVRLARFTSDLAVAARKFLLWSVTKTDGERLVRVVEVVAANSGGSAAYGQWLRQQVSFDAWKVGVNVQP